MGNAAKVRVWIVAAVGKRLTAPCDILITALPPDRILVGTNERSQLIHTEIGPDCCCGFYTVSGSVAAGAANTELEISGWLNGHA